MHAMEKDGCTSYNQSDGLKRDLQRFITALLHYIIIIMSHFYDLLLDNKFEKTTSNSALIVVEPG